MLRRTTKLMIALFVIALAVSYAYAKMDIIQSKIRVYRDTRDGSRPYASLVISDILDDIDANLDGARTKYTNQYYFCYGYVHSVSENNSGKTEVTLYDENDDLSFIIDTRFHCYASTWGIKQDIKSIKKGDLVICFGRIIRITNNSVELELHIIDKASEDDKVRYQALKGLKIGFTELTENTLNKSYAEVIENIPAFEYGNTQTSVNNVRWLSINAQMYGSTGQSVLIFVNDTDECIMVGYLDKEWKNRDIFTRSSALSSIHNSFVAQYGSPSGGTSVKKEYGYFELLLDGTEICEEWQNNGTIVDVLTEDRGLFLLAIDSEYLSILKNSMGGLSTD